MLLVELSSHREGVEEREEVGLDETVCVYNSLKEEWDVVLISCLGAGFRGRGGGGGPSFDIKGGDWPCPNRLVF